MALAVSATTLNAALGHFTKSNPLTHWQEVLLAGGHFIIANRHSFRPRFTVLTADHSVEVAGGRCGNVGQVIQESSRSLA